MILFQYVFWRTFKATLITFLVMSLLFLSLNIATELGSKVRAEYTQWEAIKYLISTLPVIMNQVMTSVVLIGLAISLNQLISSGEFTILRIANRSRIHLLLPILAPGIVAWSMLLAGNEFWGIHAFSNAEQTRNELRGGQIDGNKQSWYRDGQLRISVDAIDAENKLYGIAIVDIDMNGEILRRTVAETAVIDGKEMQLSKGFTKHYLRDEIITDAFSESSITLTSLNSDLITSKQLNPELMTWREIWPRRTYLKLNQLNPSRLDREFWLRWANPFLSLAAGLFFLAYLITSGRSTNVGVKIFVAITISLVIELLKPLLVSLLALNLSELSAIMLPTTLALVFGAMQMKKL